MQSVFFLARIEILHHFFIVFLVLTSMHLPWFSNSKFPLYLAPMAGITDPIFRTLCKELGADVMLTEFVSAEGILYNDARTQKYTTFTQAHRPCGIQLFGANPQVMAQAACHLVQTRQPDFIDLNVGCPVQKVVARNGGSSLLKDCPLLAKLAQSLVAAVGHIVPVTAKIRMGWSESTINALEVCRLLEDAGMSAIAIHGRTRTQGYRGKADWEMIARCADQCHIPVIGNGDIHSPQCVLHYKQTTPISGVMIGRAAMHNPWIFSQTKKALQGGVIPQPPSLKERWELIFRHCQLAIESGYYGNERQTMTAMRSRLMTYTKGLGNAKHIRTHLCSIQSIQELHAIKASC